MSSIIIIHKADRPVVAWLCVLALCSAYTRWGGLAHGLHGPEGIPSTFGTAGPGACWSVLALGSRHW